MGLLGHMVVLLLVFKVISILFSKVAVSSYIPANSEKGSPFYTLSPVFFFFCRFFDNGHSDQCEVIPLCTDSFDLHFFCF